MKIVGDIKAAQRRGDEEEKVQVIYPPHSVAMLENLALDKTDASKEFDTTTAQCTCKRTKRIEWDQTSLSTKIRASPH